MAGALPYGCHLTHQLAHRQAAGLPAGVGAQGAVQVGVAECACASWQQVCLLLSVNGTSLTLQQVHPRSQHMHYTASILASLISTSLWDAEAVVDGSTLCIVSSWNTAGMFGDDADLVGSELVCTVLCCVAGAVS